MKNWILLLSLTAFTLYAAPQQLLRDKDKSGSWTGMVKMVPESARKGKGSCFMLYGKYPTKLIYKEMIRISPDKTYSLKASFRTADAKLPASAYLGLQVFDKEKRPITYANLQALPDTQSSVVSARKGDSFLVVRMIKNYKKHRYFAVAFGARKDYSDIPNFDVSSTNKKICEEDGKGNLKVFLRKPLARDYAPGTPIRFHLPWEHGMYYLADGWVPAGNGKESAVTLRGVSTWPGATSSRVEKVKFWKGTVYVRPVVWFGNWNRLPKKGAKLLVDGLSFELLEEK